LLIAIITLFTTQFASEKSLLEGVLITPSREQKDALWVGDTHDP
jgi:hypothetical protein